jgi:hypothetical protein
MDDVKCRYSTELEELAYHKDSEALFKAADFVIQPQDLTPERRDTSFFNVGCKVQPYAWCDWFVWHGDHQTVLLFIGLEPGGNAMKRIRAVADREEA